MIAVDDGVPAPLGALVLRGSGANFCAGGDVKSVHAMRGDAAAQTAFFREEYLVDMALARHSHSRAPHVALWDGAAMGGGLGLSAHAAFRVATERTVLAMPETAIGFVPDVGGSFFLSRLPLGREFGRFLALTGTQLRGADALHAGFATHFLPSAALPALVRALERADLGASPEAAGAQRRYG